jgi:xylan 1,4-beta-xylosidase
VTLDWAPVPGAIGYLVHRADGPSGPFRPLDHHGGDTVWAVPQPPYTDTQVEAGVTRWYAVVAVPDAHTVGPLPAPVAAAPEAAGGPWSRSPSTRPAPPGRCTGPGGP